MTIKRPLKIHSKTCTVQTILVVSSSTTEDKLETDSPKTAKMQSLRINRLPVHDSYPEFLDQKE